jgi:ABC-type polysaccharide/polyol phosphate export permease
LIRRAACSSSDLAKSGPSASSLRDLKIRYKQTVIGVLWVVLRPVLNMLVFTLFFGRLVLHGFVTA